ncbi:MAG: PQQ-binding-like beta-propeller repeat protein [Pirellulaceae bacterium]
MTTLRVFSTIVLVIVVVSRPVQGETWPAWRGAAGQGVSSEVDLPVEWSAETNVDWSTDLPGRGNSSPAVTSKRIYLTSQTEDASLWIIAVDRDNGRIVWKTNVGSGRLAAFGPENLYAHRHNPATPSPVADEEHVWAYFGTGLLVCLDPSGKLEWQRDLAEDHGPFKMRFGMGSSPRLWQGLVFIACMHGGPSYVVAMDGRTGEVVWKQPRQFPAAEDGPQAYSSPVILQTAQRDELVVAGSDHVNAYDPLSGKQNWISSGLKIDSPYGRIIASPATSPKVLVVCSANPPGSGTDRIIALRTGGSGDITNSHRLWEYRPYNPDCPTPVCFDGSVYMVRDDGIASCLDLETGKEHWRRRMRRGTYRASVVAGDAKVYFLNLDGLCTVVQSGHEGDLLARNQLPGTFYATPAISDGQIFLRAYERLYAIGRRKSK